LLSTGKQVLANKKSFPEYFIRRSFAWSQKHILSSFYPFDGIIHIRFDGLELLPLSLSAPPLGLPITFFAFFVNVFSFAIPAENNGSQSIPFILLPYALEGHICYLPEAPAPGRIKMPISKNPSSITLRPGSDPASPGSSISCPACLGPEIMPAPWSPGRRLATDEH